VVASTTAPARRGCRGAGHAARRGCTAGFDAGDAEGFELLADGFKSAAMLLLIGPKLK
jgi:hypothetical protein